MAGHGPAVFEAVAQRDYPMLLGVLLVSSLTVVVMNLVTDVAYGILDPRASVTARGRERAVTGWRRFRANHGALAGLTCLLAVVAMTAGARLLVSGWGYMIGASRSMLQRAWWLPAFPGVAILLTVLSINLVGDGLNDALNPRTATAPAATGAETGQVDARLSEPAPHAPIAAGS